MKRLKPSEKAALSAVAFGIAIGAGLAWLLPDANAWVYIVGGFVAASGAYSADIKHRANKRIADNEFPQAGKD